MESQWIIHWLTTIPIHPWATHPGCTEVQDRREVHLGLHFVASQKMIHWLSHSHLRDHLLKGEELHVDKQHKTMRLLILQHID